MKVARTVLRGAALGNKCRLLDKNVFQMIGFKSDHRAILSYLNYQTALTL
ncbi:MULTISPECIES: hypothetical protein [Vibrio]